MSGIKNRTIFTGDNLEILRGFPNDFIDLIYLDPPFNSKHNYAAPIGSRAAGAAFKDTWTLDDVDVAWWGEIAETNRPLYEVLDMTRHVGGKSAMSYLIYMAVRILELHRVLKQTGSLYLHCDQTMSHYLKMVLDAVFGKDNFRNEIVWSYQRWTGATKHFQRMHDYILFYASSSKTKFNILKEPYSEKSKHKGSRYSKHIDGKIHQTYTEDASRTKAMRAVWEISYLNSQARERVGYPTQKPLALLERVIKASSNEGDIVLDPFCGCATTCSAAERLNRKWIGIDISPKAVELLNTRLVSEAGMDKYTKGAGILIHRTDIPIRKGNRSKNIKHQLFGMQEGRCNMCNHEMDFRHMEVDHVIPRAKGGPDDDTNLQLLCGHCNRIKGAGTMAEAKVRLKELGVLV